MYPTAPVKLMELELSHAQLPYKNKMVMKWQNFKPELLELGTCLYRITQNIISVLKQSIYFSFNSIKKTYLTKVNSRGFFFCKRLIKYQWKLNANNAIKTMYIKSYNDNVSWHNWHIFSLFTRYPRWQAWII